jgi:hypothetical protein
MEPVTVFRTFNLPEAQIVRSRLEAAGFMAEVIHELATLGTEGYSMATGGVKVQVPAEEAEDARVLIESAHEEKEGE